jgi:uncharacterized protein
MFKRLSHIAAVAAVSLATTALSSHSGNAQCRGQNLLAQLEKEKPEDFKTLRTAADAVPNGSGIFWKIEHPDRPDAPPSYLFGTIHLSDERLVSLQEPVLAAIRSSRRVALEIDDFSQRRVSAAMSAIQAETRLPQGKRLDDLVGGDSVKQLQDALGRRGIQRAAVSNLRPWFAFMMASLPACELSRTALGKEIVDVRILRTAERAAVGTIPLETLEEQFRSLARLSDADQTAILNAHMKDLSKLDDATETMIQLWLSEDTGTMMAMGRLAFQSSGADISIYDRFETEFLTSRNVVMQKRAISHLNRGGIFIAVGALHLPGEKGLVALIRDLGFTVTRVAVK